MRAGLAAILGAFFLATVLLDKVLRGVPAKELRRRAREQHSKRAAALYRLSAYGASARLFLGLIGGLSAGGLILMAAEIGWWLGLLIVLLSGWLWMSSPLRQTGGFRWWLSGLLAPLFATAVNLLQPILSPLTSRFKINRQPVTGLHEVEDLLELLKLQGRQATNRISKEELRLTAHALEFGGRSVGSVMIPRRKVRWAVVADAAGPMVMDELHQSGQNCFPVVKDIIKSGNPEIVGTLYINDLLNNLKGGGHIRDLMQPGVSYINESQSLLEATRAFLESGSGLLVVVNSFEEIVGVLTLADTLRQIFGDAVATEPGYRGDIRAAANYEAQPADSKETPAKV